MRAQQKKKKKNPPKQTHSKTTKRTRNERYREVRKVFEGEKNNIELK